MATRFLQLNESKSEVVSEGYDTEHYLVHVGMYFPFEYVSNLFSLKKKKLYRSKVCRK